MSKIYQNYCEIREEISSQAKQDCLLLPVSKYHPLEKILELYNCGLRNFAENKVQDLNDKAIAAAHEDITWHLIGPLQSNKVRTAIQHASWIHSVSSSKLLQRIERIAGEEGKQIKVLLQIKLTDEESKSGCSPDEARALLKEARNFKHCKVLGLMAMGPSDTDPIKTQEVFNLAKQLQENLQKDFSQFTELSIGMSGDYPLALKAGSTIIRVGSKIFKD